jgi:hypothetical protein
MYSNTSTSSIKYKLPEPERYQTARSLDSRLSTLNSRNGRTVQMSSTSLLTVMLDHTGLSIVYGQTHITGECRVRSPSGGSTWGLSLFHHSVDLFEGKTLGLPN